MDALLMNSLVPESGDLPEGVGRKPGCGRVSYPLKTLQIVVIKAFLVDFRVGQAWLGSGRATMCG
jgi:hypothetical protein